MNTAEEMEDALDFAIEFHTENQDCIACVNWHTDSDICLNCNTKHNKFEENLTIEIAKNITNFDEGFI